jgi:hypothetical protein
MEHKTQSESIIKRDNFNEIKEIIKDENFQKHFKEGKLKNHFHIFDGAEHFLKEEKLDEMLGEEVFDPKQLDILMCRSKSVGVNQIETIIENKKIHFLGKHTLQN